MDYRDVISKPEFNFWIPIITTIAAIALSWGALTTRISLLEVKADTLESHFVTMKAEVDDTLTKHDEILLDIQVKLAEIQKDVLYIKERL